MLIGQNDPFEIVTKNDTHGPGIEPWFGYTAGLLLLMVVAGLTGLSLRLYHRARQAETGAAQAQEKLDEQSAAWALLSRSIGAPPASLDRQALAARAGQLDGQPVTVLTATSEQGRTLGLDPGDVLVIAPEAPATRGAGAGGD